MRAARSVVPFQPPPPKPPKVVVPFRADPESVSWLREFTGEPKPTISEITDWAVKLGRVYYEAMKVHGQRIDELAKAEGISEGEMLAKLVGLGIEALERGGKGKR